MRRRSLLVGLSAQVGVRIGAGARQCLAAGEIGVVASFSVLADMAREVGGGMAAVTSLVPPDMDAHMYQPTAGDSRGLTAAALLVENGFGLEGWMARLGAASGFHGVKVVATAGVKPRTLHENALTSIDPHAWQDPRNGAIYARNIAEGLAAADPVRADAYRTNAARYVAEIEQTDTWIAAQYATIPEAARRIITTHDAFGYYGDRYGITFLAAEGLSTDAEPSAKAIAALVAQIRREKVRTVFLENMTDPRLATMLARETGTMLAGPLYSDALSQPDEPAPDYLTMLRYNTTLFARAMRPV